MQVWVQKGILIESWGFTQKKSWLRIKNAMNTYLGFLTWKFRRKQETEAF